VLTIQAGGIYEGANELIVKYAVNPPAMNMYTLREKISDFPVEIKPVYYIEKGAINQGSQNKKIAVQVKEENESLSAFIYQSHTGVAH